jgi:predicted ATP-grasp superfamily ATP-dependent carboligase
LEPAVRIRFDQLGLALARGFHLQGLFGVDCVLRAGVPWPVEVNPRYTASVEVLELATGESFLAQHGHVFEPTLPTGPPAVLGFRTAIVGKAILFARSSLRFPEDGPWRVSQFQAEYPWPLPEYADIPPAGSRIPAHRPILTIFAQAASVAECAARLRDLASDLDRRLFGP